MSQQVLHDSMIVVLAAMKAFLSHKLRTFESVVRGGEFVLRFIVRRTNFPRCLERDVFVVVKLVDANYYYGCDILVVELNCQTVTAISAVDLCSLISVWWPESKAMRFWQRSI